jgi:hypothetical protein
MLHAGRRPDAAPDDACQSLVLSAAVWTRDDRLGIISMNTKSGMPP